MKANAPEKIYLQQYDENTLICLNKWNVSEEWSNKPLNEKVATNIEYVLYDAFIEKACGWIKENITNNPNANSVLVQNGCVTLGMLIEDFKNYMKGEEL